MATTGRANAHRAMCTRRHSQDRIEVLNAWNVDHEVEIAMEALRCPPRTADVTLLSGGERRRVAMARLLLSSPGARPASAATATLCAG